MILNYIWIGFFVVGFLVTAIKCFDDRSVDLIHVVIKEMFNMAEYTVMDLALPLIGIMAFWLGIMKIGEDAGLVNILSKRISPFFTQLFKGVPANHKSHSSIAMNFSANMLGLDNAATPLGLKAMGELDEVNQTKGRASDAMIMFLVLNTSGLTIIPTTIIGYRAAAGAENPTDVFLPILIATSISTLVGLTTVCINQRINFLKGALGRALLMVVGILTLLIIGLGQLNQNQLELASGIATGTLIFGVLTLFMGVALYKRINAYESFVVGATEGFKVAVKIIPYLIAILCSIAVFRYSGAMLYMEQGIGWFFGLFFEDTRFVDGIPTAIMKPLSGGGAKGLMLESWTSPACTAENASCMVDSFRGKLTSILQGSTETTFYVLAVYFGSVGIKNSRNALLLGLVADLAGIIAAILLAYHFFG